jgi:maltoporin
VSKYQVRLYDISTTRIGTLDIAVEGRRLGGDRDGVPGTYGIAVYGMHTQKLLGGFNQAIFQYGQGLAADLGISSDLKAENHARTYRLIDWALLQPSSYFTAGLVVIYQRATGTQSFPAQWFSVGARPIYSVTDRFRIALEVGADFVAPDGSPMRQLTKVTLAPELAVGNAFFDRPVLRVFGTFANWNHAAAANGVVLSSSNISPFDNLYGFTAGVQSEAWW